MNFFLSQTQCYVVSGLYNSDGCLIVGMCLPEGDACPESEFQWNGCPRVPDAFDWNTGSDESIYCQDYDPETVIKRY